MDTPVDSPSLTPIRLAAAIGFVIAVVLVVAGLRSTWWLGVLAFSAVPVLPMLSVLALERVQSH